MRRVLLDTNVLVSSVLVRHGGPARIIQAWSRRQFLLITSQALMDEVRRTLGYARIRRKYHVTDEMVSALIDVLERDALVVGGMANVAGALPEDPDDEAVLAAAVDGRADVIVSADSHLLKIEMFEGIPIASVQPFVASIAE